MPTSNDQDFHRLQELLDALPRFQEYEKRIECSYEAQEIVKAWETYKQAESNYSYYAQHCTGSVALGCTPLSPDEEQRRAWDLYQWGTLAGLRKAPVIQAKEAYEKTLNSSRFASYEEAIGAILGVQEQRTLFEAIQDYQEEFSQVYARCLAES